MNAPRHEPPPLAEARLRGGPRIMGVVNVTPDSFSDGGRFVDPARARDQALALIEAGADIIDVGGQSTRPRADDVSASEEIARTAPAIEAIRSHTNAPISIDTMKPDVARAAFAAGASMWNDVTALAGAGALETAGELGGDVVLMHMQGESRTMQDHPQYDDVVGEVIGFLNDRLNAALAAGVKRARLWVDPGFGFGKTLAHNLELTRALARIRAETGAPIVFGASRKSAIAKIDPGASVDQRLGGSVALALYAARRGADMIRVHDVKDTVQALKVDRALRSGR